VLESFPPEGIKKEMSLLPQTIARSEEMLLLEDVVYREGLPKRKGSDVSLLQKWVFATRERRRNNKNSMLSAIYERREFAGEAMSATS